jgi:hypothetical protein
LSRKYLFFKPPETNKSFTRHTPKSFNYSSAGGGRRGGATEYLTNTITIKINKTHNLDTSKHALNLTPFITINELSANTIIARKQSINAQFRQVPKCIELVLTYIKPPTIHKK